MDFTGTMLIYSGISQNHVPSASLRAHYHAHCFYLLCASSLEGATDSACLGYNQNMLPENLIELVTSHVEEIN